MKKFVFLVLILLSLGGGMYFWKTQRAKKMKEPKIKSDLVPLSAPRKDSEVSLEEAIARRRSRRDFTNEPLTLEQLGQILWAAQGITDKKTGFRTAPSAGALYPLEIYVVVKEEGEGLEGVEGLEGGVYHYRPEEHALELHLRKDVHQDFVAACLGQGACEQAPVSLVVAAVYERMTGKYGERGRRYVDNEVGHVGQNIYLQTESLGLGAVVIGAFIDEEVSRVLNLPSSHKPLYIMPLGRPG